MNLKQEQAEKTRQDLLNAALIVFSKKGYSATRLEDIALQAGVTRGAFYWHFKNKSDVFLELHSKIIHDFIDIMKNEIKEKQTPLENLKNILYKTMTKLLNNEKSRQYGKLFYMIENSPDLANGMNILRKKIEHTVFSLFSDLINKGKESDEIRVDLPTRQIYRSAIVTLKGSIVQIFDNIATFTAGDAESTVNIFIDGIKKQQ